MRNVSISAALAVLLSTHCVAEAKKRVAILNFDYSTVQSSVSAIFGTSADVGKGVSDLLVEQLVKGGTYTVIERKALTRSWLSRSFRVGTSENVCQNSVGYVRLASSTCTDVHAHARPKCHSPGH